MKTKPILMLAALLTLLTTGCTNLGKKMQDFEKLGITDATITGKFSNTSYHVEHKDGHRVATIDHSNAWMPKVVLVRKTPLDSQPED